MMQLYSERDKAELDFLIGEECVTKVLECHGTTDDDAYYTFLIWTKDDTDEKDFLGRLMAAADSCETSVDVHNLSPCLFMWTEDVTELKEQI